MAAGGGFRSTLNFAVVFLLIGVPMLLVALAPIVTVTLARYGRAFFGLKVSTLASFVNDTLPLIAFPLTLTLNASLVAVLSMGWLNRTEILAVRSTPVDLAAGRTRTTFGAETVRTS